MRVKALISTLFVAVCATAPVAAAETLEIGTTTDLDTANPFGLSGDSGWEVTVLGYDMLLKFGSADLGPEASLATGCDHSEDYRTWTCHLRPGLRWSDGTPLTSEDVAFSYRFVIKHKISLYTSYFPSDPVFETPDPQTLVWKAKEPTFAPDMPPWVYIVPKHIWEKHDGKQLEEISNIENVPSVVSGPYAITDWQRGQGWTLSRNPNFWGEPPTYDEIHFRLYTNQDALALALKNGEVDIADGLDSSTYDALSATENVKVQTIVPDRWINFAFNFGGQAKTANPHPALKDIVVRRAILQAIDRQAIVDKVYRGLAEPGTTMIRPLSARWHLDLPAEEQLPYDPQAANAALDAAGYRDTDGDGVREDPRSKKPLALRMPADQPTPGAVDSGRLIVGFLKAIGIKATLIPVSDAKMNDFWGAGNWDAYIWYWSGDPDPMYQLSVFLSSECGGRSDGCWNDPTYDDLYRQQATMMDQDKRLEIVHEMQRRVYDQVPSIVLAYPRSLQAWRTDRVDGIAPVPGPDGYLIGSYNYDSALSLKPKADEPPPASGAQAVSAEPTAAATTSSSGVPGWVFGGIAVVGLGAIVALVASRRRNRDDEA